MKPGKLTVRHRKCPFFPGKYHQIAGFSMAMLVYLSVMVNWVVWVVWDFSGIFGFESGHPLL